MDKAAVNQTIRDGKQPHEAYAVHGDTLSEEWNKITGGSSFVSALFPLGRYLKLAANNADHFAEWALLAYIAGHMAALQQAVLAHNNGDEKQWELASGQSLKGAPLELLVKSLPIARATADAQGYATFDAKQSAGALTVRVDRSILSTR